MAASGGEGGGRRLGRGTPWAGALVLQGAAQLKVAAARPALRVHTPSQAPQPGGCSARLDFEPSLLLPRGARAEAAPSGSFGIRLTPRPRLLITSLGVQKSLAKRVRVACVRFFFCGRQRSNSSLSFATEVRVLSLHIITLHFCSAFTHFRTVLLYLLNFIAQWLCLVLLRTFN